MHLLGGPVRFSSRGSILASAAARFRSDPPQRNECARIVGLLAHPLSPLGRSRARWRPARHSSPEGTTTRSRATCCCPACCSVISQSRSGVQSGGLVRQGGEAVTGAAKRESDPNWHLRGSHDAVSGDSGGFRPAGASSPGPSGARWSGLKPVPRPGGSCSR